MASSRAGVVYRKRLLELTLSHVDVCQTGGRRGSRAGDHLITVRLIWPRPLTADRVSVRTVQLSDGKADLTGKAWCDRVLFKETVEGRFGIEVSVSERLPAGQAGEFFASFGSAVNKLAASELAAGVDSAVAGRLWAMPFNYLASVAGQQTKESSLRSVARGVLDLGTDAPVRAGEWFEIAVPMAAPSDVRAITKVRRHGQSQIRRRRALREGEDNGTVCLCGWFHE